MFLASLVIFLCAFAPIAAAYRGTKNKTENHHAVHEIYLSFPKIPSAGDLTTRPVPHQQAGHVTAPDQCCNNVKKALAMAPSTRDP